MKSLGPLTAADEMLTHQIVDTFASVAQTDRSWTEKVCAMACAKAEKKALFVDAWAPWRHT